MPRAKKKTLAAKKKEAKLIIKNGEIELERRLEVAMNAVEMMKLEIHKEADTIIFNMSREAREMPWEQWCEQQLAAMMIENDEDEDTAPLPADESRMSVSAARVTVVLEQTVTIPASPESIACPSPPPVTTAKPPLSRGAAKPQATPLRTMNTMKKTLLKKNIITPKVDMNKLEYVSLLALGHGHRSLPSTAFRQLREGEVAFSADGSPLLTAVKQAAKKVDHGKHL